MTAVKERIIGALSLMNDIEAEKVWIMIQNKFFLKEKTWEDVEEIVPDEIDLQMLKSISEDPDCKEFISAEDAYKELGLDG